MHRTVYSLQEFHSLFQGDMTVNDYCSRLKKLFDILRDVGHPVSNAALVVSTLRGLNPKFTNAISVLGSRTPPPDFLFVRSYLIQEERRMANTHKMEAATALLATGSSTSSSPGKSTSPASNFSPNKFGSKKKKKSYDGRSRNNADAPQQGQAPPQQQPWGTAYNPWTGVVQFWSMPPWHAPGSSVLGPRPNANQALTASYQAAAPSAGILPPPQQQLLASPQLLAALQGGPALGSYSGGGDWFLDTGASTHMAFNPGNFSITAPCSSSSHIVFGNGATLPVHHTAQVSIPTPNSTLHLNNILILLLKILSLFVH
jgi:hypothetical protein